MQQDKLTTLYPALDGRLTILNETGSTNNVVKDMLKNGAHLPVVIARSQTSGKGRAGRSFGSPPNTGLYLTMGIPPLPDPDLPLTALVGCCVCRGIEQVSRCTASLKWVNDVLILEKKVCGILCEAGPGGVAIGIGINANTPGDYFKTAELPHATSILEAVGTPVDMEALAAVIIGEVDAMSARLGDTAYFTEALGFYRSRLVTLGREIMVIAADGKQRRGFARNIDERAGLIVDFDGVRETVDFGDVSVRGIYGYV